MLQAAAACKLDLQSLKRCIRRSVKQALALAPEKLALQGPLRSSKYFYEADCLTSVFYTRILGIHSAYGLARKPDFKLLELATTFNGVTPDQSRRIGQFAAYLEDLFSSKFGQLRLQIQIEGRSEDIPELSRVAPERVFGDENVQRS